MQQPSNSEPCDRLRPLAEELARFNAERERIVRTMRHPPGEQRIPLRHSGVGGDIPENDGA